MSKKPRTKLFLLGVIIIVVAAVYGVLDASLGPISGTRELKGLSAASVVNSDALGIPKIQALSRNDAYLVLGFLHARDRMFQMELMRRKSAGRLAEIFGTQAVKLDWQQRSLQLEASARAVIHVLPQDQRQVLQAYVAGVNAYLQQAPILAPEFLLLHYQPEIWREEDSILVALAMFQTLNGDQQDERMLTIMQQVLPEDLVRFLTPDTDVYAQALVGGKSSRRFSPQIPLSDFAALPASDETIAANSVQSETTLAGSNSWVVAAKKSLDGRALLANDMHLGLSVPNIWYRAELQYAQSHLYGVTLPGVPAVIVGGNDHVAWGFTNATADLLDLVTLEINPENSQEYRSTQGWKPFVSHQEVIKVKDAAEAPVNILESEWGPVAEHDVAGKPVALKWIAHDPQAVNFGLIDMDQVKSLPQAIALMNQAGVPPQNVVMADHDGHIAWTLTGRFPQRIGFDGLISRSWADGKSRWNGFIRAEELPSLLDPPEGFIATANNRTLGRDYPHVLGYNWALSYRAYRINQLLREGEQFSEQDLLNIQLDTRSEVYDFYQQLALDVALPLKDKNESMKLVEQSMSAWDGYMNAESKGVPLLQEFRKRLAQEVFAKVVNACRAKAADFSYQWRTMEMPLRQLLVERPSGVLRSHFQNDWGAMIRTVLEQSVSEISQKYPGKNLAELSWGEAQSVTIRHPFSKNLSWVSNLLDMVEFPQSGCLSYCVKISSNDHGASERMVVSPAHLNDGIMLMPTGQSGNFFSRHYRDQQGAWQQGKASALLSGKSEQVLHLLPVGH